MISHDKRKTNPGAGSGNFTVSLDMHGDSEVLQRKENQMDKKIFTALAIKVLSWPFTPNQKCIKWPRALYPLFIHMNTSGNALKMA